MTSPHSIPQPAIEIRHVSTSAEMESIRQLFVAYVQSLETDLAFQNFQEELYSLPGKYAPPKGALFLALVEGKAAGCIALRPMEDKICEMKRLYVDPEYRHLGLGKQLVEKILDEGQKLGYNCMRLDTLTSMTAALALYRAQGFQAIPPYTYNPLDGAIYMERRLE
ncbi:GNAT family N-acetyltransferase [Proteiniclasticum sp. BAD-10]|uniref:GNAT family N-acetyltransferase n=1 Tax=Proteiniclasticum sediminis TaxID=2804028 RepID=A0A941HR49_9CLOT|nr:GNAT family N-acetyltransferase [Proteiniclasticum sediminis]MBR0577199.1 GNAT family N-acetyltransferase [Proteiniclasticum sediminis]